MLKNEWWKISQIIIYHSLRRCPNSNQNNGVLNWPSDVGNDLLPCRLYDRVYFLTIITIWTRAFGKGNLSTFMFMKSNACTFTRLEHLNIQCNYSSSNDEEKNFFYFFFFPCPHVFTLLSSEFEKSTASYYSCLLKTRCKPLLNLLLSGTGTLN